MDQALVHEGSDRMEFPRVGRRSGWSDMENKLLWETADEAQQQGLPLKAVFEQIARQTGRRPNSIRNYYYAQVREHDGDAERPARFVPFTQQEVDWLMEQVLVARSAGQSVRSCLQKLSGGDHSLMLRYQNKYRAVIKSRPDYVQGIVEKLKSQGVECETPQVNHRVRADLHQSGEAHRRRRAGPRLRRADAVSPGTPRRPGGRRPGCSRPGPDRTHQGVCCPGFQRAYGSRGGLLRRHRPTHRRAGGAAGRGSGINVENHDRAEGGQWPPPLPSHRKGLCINYSYRMR